MPELPVAAPDPTETRDPFADDVLERLLRSDAQYQQTHGHYIVPLSERLLAVRAERAALLAERQQDKERIERLETALNEARPYVEWMAAGPRDAADDASTAKAVLAQVDAALAVEEDARPGKPETPGNSGAAVEEDAE